VGAGILGLAPSLLDHAPAFLSVWRMNSESARSDFHFWPTGHRARVAEPGGATRSTPTARLQADLGPLEPSWRALDELLPSPIEGFDWAAACAASFQDRGRVQILTLEEQGRVVAAVPMMRVGRALNARLEHIGIHRLHEPMDLAVEDPADLDRLVESLVALGIPFTLGRLPASSPTVAALAKAVKGRGLVLTRENDNYPFIPLDQTWADPEQTLSSKRRSDVRRARRHAEKTGAVRTEIKCPSLDEVDAAVELAIEVESRSWKGEQGDDMATDEEVGRFFREYGRRAASAGTLRMCFLWIGDDVAAMLIGVVQAGKFWVLKVGYDPQFNKASPGILLMIEAIKYSVDQGLTSFELLGSVEAWTQVWTKYERSSVTLRVYPRNLRGATVFMRDALASARSRLDARRS
jgi:CelD/BcsL family acetyltransferase involved in cellulose biosynthesis